MAMWVFGYGPIIWKTGFPYDERHVGFIKDYRRVFYQGFEFRSEARIIEGLQTFLGEQSHWNLQRGSWGAAYKITNKKDQLKALEYLEVREKQYDKKAYVDFFTESNVSRPSVSDVMVYIASADKKLNQNYLGHASLEDIAIQIVKAKGPSGPNREYLFKLESALAQIGCEDKHVTGLANEVRRTLLLQGELIM